jgi:hypothetical protein
MQNREKTRNGLTVEKRIAIIIIAYIIKYEDMGFMNVILYKLIFCRFGMYQSPSLVRDHAVMAP